MSEELRTPTGLHPGDSKRLRMSETMKKIERVSVTDSAVKSIRALIARRNLSRGKQAAHRIGILRRTGGWPFHHQGSVQGAPGHRARRTATWQGSFRAAQDHGRPGNDPSVVHRQQGPGGRAHGTADGHRTPCRETGDSERKPKAARTDTHDPSANSARRWKRAT